MKINNHNITNTKQTKNKPLTDYTLAEMYELCNKYFLNKGYCCWSGPACSEECPFCEEGDHCFLLRNGLLQKRPCYYDEIKENKNEITQ